MNGLPLQSGAHICTDILPAHSCPLSSGRQEGLLLTVLPPSCSVILDGLYFPLEQELNLRARGSAAQKSLEKMGLDKVVGSWLDLEITACKQNQKLDE